MHVPVITTAMAKSNPARAWISAPAAIICAIR